MALNEIQMSQLSEGSTGTGGRVDELTLPVDISRRSRSEQVDVNEKDLELELNLQNENFGTGHSGGGSEADELVHDPVSESRSEAEVEGQGHVTFLDPIREEDQDDGGGRTHHPVGDPESNPDPTETDTETVEEEPADRICRTCGPDEETTEPDNLLVKLGCHCRGSLSRMHRKCILEWYGRRIFHENNYECEVCNAPLHGRIEHIVFRAIIGRDSGTDILIRALGIMDPRNAIVEVSQAQDGNAHPDFYEINIVEGPPHDPIGPLAPTDGPERRRPEYVDTDRTSPMCVLVFIIFILIGFAVSGIGKLR